MIRRLATALALAAALPVVLVLRAVAPIVRVRFGRLASHRFGHFLINTEVGLCQRDRERAAGRGRTVDVFYHTPPVSNTQLARMWSRVITIWQPAQWLDRVNGWMPGAERHRLALPARDLEGLLATTPPHLTFTAEEERRGHAGLRRLGVPEGARYVCFNARDAAYQRAMFPQKVFPPQFHDSDVDNYRATAVALTQRGYHAIRMGAVVEKPLSWTQPGIVDYATGHREEFLDLYLGATCAFFVGHSGITMLPMIFRRPVAIVNFIPLAYAPVWNPWDLFIPKKLWLRRARRFLTFREILDSDIGWNIRYPHGDHDLEVVENSADEILALAMEMDDRLRGVWKTTDEDDELQRRFWALWKPSHLNGVFRARIGAEFLRQHAALLG